MVTRDFRSCVCSGLKNGGVWWAWVPFLKCFAIKYVWWMVANWDAVLDLLPSHFFLLSNLQSDTCRMRLETSGDGRQLPWFPRLVDICSNALVRLQPLSNLALVCLWWLDQCVWNVANRVSTRSMPFFWFRICHSLILSLPTDLVHMPRTHSSIAYSNCPFCLVARISLRSVIHSRALLVWLTHFG